MASDVLQLGRRERGRRVPLERRVPVVAGGGALFKEREPPEVLDGPEPGPPCGQCFIFARLRGGRVLTSCYSLRRVTRRLSIWGIASSGTYGYWLVAGLRF